MKHEFDYPLYNFALFGENNHEFNALEFVQNH